MLRFRGDERVRVLIATMTQRNGHDAFPTAADAGAALRVSHQHRVAGADRVGRARSDLEEVTQVARGVQRHVARDIDAVQQVPQRGRRAGGRRRQRSGLVIVDG